MNYNSIVRPRSDKATEDSGKVRLGDFSPVFNPEPKKVAKDAATEDSGKVRLGDFSPAF
jgi:hypothetical protein